MAQDRAADLQRWRDPPIYMGVLNEVAEFLTACQAAGQAIEWLELPFQGLAFGPVLAARGYSVDQLVDGAVRTVSAFGNADDLLEDDAPLVSRNTVKTADFLRSLRRFVAGDDEDAMRPLHAARQGACT